MRKIGQLTLYVAALCAAVIAAAYVSLLLSPRLESAPDVRTPATADGADSHQNSRSGLSAERQRIRVPTAAFADHVYRSSGAALAGMLVFMAVHVFGFARLKGGFSQLFAEPDPEDLIPGLRIYGLAVLAGAVIGGVVGRLIG